MTKECVLANAKVVLRDEVITGAVVMHHGVITAIDQGTHVPKGAVNCEGATLCPGLIELHTDNLERHMRPRPRVDWPQKAAIVAHDRELAATGITTVFDAVRVGGIISTRSGRFRRYARDAVDALSSLRHAGHLKVSHYIHLRAELCSETLIEELAEFGDGDAVRIISLMDHTPGQRQFRDLQQFEDYVCTKNGMSRDGFEDYVVFLKDLQARVLHTHEQAAVAAAKRFGATLASHDDTTPGQVCQSHANGVTLAEFPTTVEAAETCRALGISTMMGAPNLVRGGSHSGNVAAHELAALDRLDIMSSDYVPAALLLGAVQLGTLWDDVARGIATVTAAPAAAVGLSDRGEIAIGKRADLCLFQMADDTPLLQSTWSQGRRIS